MPWLAVPWRRTNIRTELAQLFGVRGIPTLLLIDSNGHLITYDARQDVTEDPQGQNFPWKPKPVNVLTDRYIAKLYDYPAVILFVDGEETEVQFAEAVLRPVAEAYYKKSNINLDTPDEDFLYGCDHELYLQFLIGVDSETADIVRELTGIDDVVPLLVAVDISNRKVAVMEYGVEITEESVACFTEQFQKGELHTYSIVDKMSEQVNDKSESR
ncbi:nucleoredoxin-like [Agrilus planipennis]|uniref:Nucleoredoxin-like n=1 Tax=Agrilus planipennis TaxID=224129 RepID=A0A1W4XG92_AGRPL|nr:nucleoredoxin-like [Agrilus planipennis]